MKNILLFLLIILMACSSPAEKSAHLPAKIKDLPIGIKVSHNVDTAYATLNTDLDRGYKYKWIIETTVSTMDKELVITEFGGFSFENNSWVERNYDSRAYNTTDFEQWYNAPGGILKKGMKYTDFNNWSTSDNLSAGESEAIWYFIGEDKEGNKYVGYKSIYTKPELK